jgi:protoporphyrinogen/coproporphyrinogen III oxidase
VPTLHPLIRWSKAIPHYTLGHLAGLAAVEHRLAALPGVLVAGSAYPGSGLPDCIDSGEKTGESALKFVLDSQQDAGQVSDRRIEIGG